MGHFERLRPLGRPSFSSFLCLFTLTGVQRSGNIQQQAADRSVCKSSGSRSPVLPSSWPKSAALQPIVLLKSSAGVWLQQRKNQRGHFLRGRQAGCLFMLHFIQKQTCNVAVLSGKATTLSVIGPFLGSREVNRFPGTVSISDQPHVSMSTVTGLVPAVGLVHLPG